jgi:type VII secretion protein EccB
MATRKDQLDAFVFARRRMVANLIAPTPTGSDEAAPRPVKTFFVSAILSAIAVAGVAVLGVFKPSAPSGWESGLAVDSSSGAAYVYSAQDKELHPVLNITSARLLLGPNFKKFDVPDDVINGAGVTIGAPFGIQYAPPDVPASNNVDLTQWTLCLQSKNPADQTQAGGKTILEIGYGVGNGGVSSSTGFVVHNSADNNYLVVGDYAYQIVDNKVLNELASISVDPGAPAGPWVSQTWLNAFKRGTSLQFPTVDGMGESLPSSLNAQPGGHVGDYGSMTGANGQQVGYIETKTGLVEVNYFVYLLYSAGPHVSQSGAQKMSLTASEVSAAAPKDEQKDATSLQNAGVDWPQNAVTPIDSDGVHPGFGVFCVNYSGVFDTDGAPQLSLSYGTQLPQPLTAGAGVAQSGATLADIVLVRPGHAALARDVSGGASQNTGHEYLVTDTGTRYEMTPTATLPPQGPGAQPTKTSAAKQLRYDTVHVSAVPDSWMQLIQTGAPLDPSQAGTTPTLSSQ